ncbi:MAG: DUF4010 domain-containing protein [Hyphomicrobiaceae bacterium]|nr:DUF4010 domain-containing protein [Hyphomicrobiaceae bacterium]
METTELFQRFSVALAVGLLIGLERGWQEREDNKGVSAGLRTHALSAMLGATWGAIALGTGTTGPIALGLAFLVFSLIIAFYRFREISHEGQFGTTTVVAAMMAFALGAYAIVGNYQVAAATGVAATALLSLKRALQEWVRKLTWIELRSAIVLLAMTFILLPILPNRQVPALLNLNPYEIWLMTVMIAAISFAGYIAVRVAGQKRGLLITGAAGGLVSSTAVTVTLAHVAHDYPQQKNLATAAALIAGAIMMIRVIVVVGVFNQHVMLALIPPLLSAAAVTAIAAYMLAGRELTGPGAASEIELKNPFELSTVLKFGALLAVIMLLADLAKAAAGTSGLLGLAAISGIADVDAITLTMSRQAGADVSHIVAARAIAIAVGVNTISKAAIAWLTGGRGPGLPMAIVAALAIFAAALALLLVPLGVAP